LPARRGVRQQPREDGTGLREAFRELAHLPFAERKEGRSARAKKKLAPAKITTPTTAHSGVSMVRVFNKGDE
jgi:hypothetical protein